MSPRAIPIAIALLLGPSAALAFDTSKLGQRGSLPLDDLMPLIGKTAALKGEVDQALDQAKKKPDEIMCGGMRFPGRWVHLGGERVAPYTCGIGDRWLRIRATVKITDRRGRAFEKITPEAMKSASKVSETNLTWTWSNEEPPDD